MHLRCFHLASMARACGSSDDGDPENDSYISWLLARSEGIRTPDPQIRSYVLRVYPSPWPSRENGRVCGLFHSF